MTCLLTLEFQDQLPTPFINQEERLPGMQKMERKGKESCHVGNGRGVTSCRDQPAEECDSSGKRTQLHLWGQAKGGMLPSALTTPICSRQLGC